MTVALASDAASSSLATEAVLGVAIIALIAVPGFALGVVSGRGGRDPDAGDQPFLARAAMGSVIIHAPVLPWTVALARAVRHDGLPAHTIEVSAWLLVVCALIPVLVGNIWLWFASRPAETLPGKIVKFLGVDAANRTANAWSDIVAGRTDSGGFALITLRDGRVMTGFCGARTLFSTNPGKPDMYVEQAAYVGPDGMFACDPDSRGFWVNGDDVASIEFFLSEEDRMAMAERAQRRPSRRAVLHLITRKLTRKGNAVEGHPADTGDMPIVPNPSVPADPPVPAEEQIASSVPVPSELVVDVDVTVDDTDEDDDKYRAAPPFTGVPLERSSTAAPQDRTVESRPLSAAKSQERK